MPLTDRSLPVGRRHLIHCLLRRNPVERLSFEEFFRHPFIATAEELAVPLPPRAPFSSLPGVTAVAASAGGGVLMFSTSAPAVAAPALGPRTRSSGSIPQQVLGFRQQQQPGAQPAAAPPAAASGGAAVPVGGLSHQLKPRRSLDLDGTAALAQHVQQAQQQQQQQQQRRPQPVAGRRLGSIQRVQGFTPAGPAPLSGQAQQAQWMLGQRSPLGAAAAPAPPSSAAAAPAPSSRPASRQQVQQQGGHSVHSEDDDYVLVDTAHSAHTAVGQHSSKAPSPQPSRPASATGSLEGSRHTAASAEGEPGLPAVWR